MNNHTIVSISPGSHYSGLAVMDAWELKAIIPIALKGLKQTSKIERLKQKLVKVFEQYRPELVVIEKLEGKRVTQDNRQILIQIVGIVTAYGLPVRYLSAAKAKKLLCPESRNPRWQEVVERAVEHSTLTSIVAKDFLARFTGKTENGELNRNFRLYPLSDSKQYYWNALVALILGLAYFANNNNIHYEYENNNHSTQETSPKTDGRGDSEPKVGTDRA